MESLDSNFAPENTSFISGEIKSYLTETVKWAKFLAIMGYIGIGLILLLAVGVMFMGGISSAIFPGGGMGGMSMGAFGLIYVVLAAFYFFPVYYLHQFSIKIKEGLTSTNSQSITAGFQNLKSLFKYMGIFTIVIMSLYALIIIVAIAAGAVASM